MREASLDPGRGKGRAEDQWLVLVVTFCYFFVELYGGLVYGSLALVTDAAFMAVNVTGQMIAFAVVHIARRRPDKHNTFGYERAKVLASLLNGMLVGFILFHVLSDAVRSIRTARVIETGPVLSIAVLGLLVNLFGLLRLRRHATDINVRGVMVYGLTDALGSVGVIVSSLLIRMTGWNFVDPLTGVLIGLLAAYPAYDLVRDGIRILMEANPGSFDPDDVTRFLTEQFRDVCSVKDVHIWALSTEKILLVARVRTHDAEDHRTMIRSMKELLKVRFGLHDVFIEGYDTGPGNAEVALPAEAPVASAANP